IPTDEQLARLTPTNEAESVSDSEHDLATEEGRVAQLTEWYRTAETAQVPWERQAREDMDFYLGRQWNPKDVQQLDTEGRPALTWNYLLPAINLVSGLMRQNRQDLKAFNLKGGTREVAEILTSLFKHISGLSQGDWHEAMAFLVGCITGKAFIGA